MAKKPHNQADNPTTDGDSGRNEKGQFVAGHTPIGSTGPAQKKGKELKEALLAAITVEDIQIIMKKQIARAKEGNLEAAKFVFDRCLGKPKEISDVDVNMRPAPPKADFDEVMDYAVRFNRISVLGGLDMRSIEGGGRAHKMG